MKKTLLFLAALPSILLAQISVKNPRTENLENPLGLDTPQPRFGWQLQTDRRDTRQTAYEIRVADNERDLSASKNLIWYSGKVNSDASVWVPFGGSAKLESAKKYFWQVRVWDNHGNASDWCEPQFWQMGLLSEADWKAKWIAAPPPDDASRTCPIFIKTFNGGHGVVSATAFVTAHGLYEAEINGKRVGNAYFTPGWTSYHNRLQYQVYDVTELLRAGENSINVTLANGWWSGIFGFENQKGIYGNEPALLFQLEIEHADGSRETVVSDETWVCNEGKIKYSEIYHGEVHNGTGVSSVPNVQVVVQDFPKNNLIATYNEPIRKQETFSPGKIFRTPKGELVADFGQNLVGWVKLKATGKGGDTIKMQFAEVLDKAGNFYTENLRSAKATDVWVLSGSARFDNFSKVVKSENSNTMKMEEFEPHFTFHGFRYCKIEGYPGELKPENITAVALYSDMRPAGKFNCSDSLINQLQHNIGWGQRGNFLDVPTDCPQRDERMGWTGDAQAFSRTAMFNFDAHNFFCKWLKDFPADQREDGAVPFVIPNCLGKNDVASTGWADAATIIPWNVYLAYGDRRVLEDQFESMKRWVDFMRSKSTDDLWNTGFHFGDWLFYDVDDDRDGRSAITDKYFIAQCFYAHSTQLLVNTAQLLGKNDAVLEYSNLLEKVKTAFLREYVTPSGRLISGTQTAYTLALHFDLLPENQRERAAKTLAENVKSYDHHITTGFLGTPLICHVLTRFGYTDVAHKLLLQKTYPSWLYPVTKGATTIWERWDGIKPDGSFQSATMNSFNHYAYGAIGDWLYRVMAGLDTENTPEGVGYKKIRIKPHLGGGFTHASAELETPYGKAASRWRLEGKNLTLEVEIPANSTASVFVPAPDAANILENGKPLTASPEIKTVGKEGEWVALKVGSGKYVFSVK